MLDSAQNNTDKEAVNNKREFNALGSQKLTEWSPELGHYTLLPMRGCFERCKRCFDLTEADSFEEQGSWFWKPECQFCVQRVIDLLGYHEHGNVPTFSTSPTKKDKKQHGSAWGSFISALKYSAERFEREEEDFQRE